MARKRGYRPFEEGPRIEWREDSKGLPYATYDLRPWGGPRYFVARVPESHRSWPKRGEKILDARSASEHAWAHVRWIEQRTGKSSASSDTFGAKIDAYLAHRLDGQTINTYKNDRSFLNKHISAGLRARKMTSIGKEDLQEVFRRLRQKNYQLSSLHQYRTQLSGFFTWLEPDLPNLAQQVVLPELGEHDAFFFDDEEIALLRKAADALGNPLYRCVLELALATGGRKSELGALKAASLDPERRAVRFTHQVSDKGTLAMLKGKRARSALILPFFWEHLGAFNAPYLLGGSQAWPGWKTYWWLRRVVRKAGLWAPGIGAHSFRHTYARLCLERYEISMEQLRLFLGHVRLETTDRTYGHLRESAVFASAKRRAYGEGGTNDGTNGGAKEA